MRRRATNYIVIHCSATRAVQDIGVAEIDTWHRARGWSAVGYHYVIRRNGTIENGRALDQAGAHVANHNADSVGVCLVGGLANEAPYAPQMNYTRAQMNALFLLVLDLVRRYPGATVLGHRDFPGVAKACPCFDARAWAREHNLPVHEPMRGAATPEAQAATGVGSGTAGAGAYQAANMVAADQDAIAAFLGTATEKVAALSFYVRAFAYVLIALGVASLLYSLGKIVWRAWRGQRLRSAPADDPSMLVEGELP